MTEFFTGKWFTGELPRSGFVQQAFVAPLTLRPPAHALHFVTGTSTLAKKLFAIGA